MESLRALSLLMFAARAASRACPIPTSSAAWKRSGISCATRSIRRCGRTVARTGRIPRQRLPTKKISLTGRIRQGRNETGRLGQRVGDVQIINIRDNHGLQPEENLDYIEAASGKSERGTGIIGP